MNRFKYLKTLLLFQHFNHSRHCGRCERLHPRDHITGKILCHLPATEVPQVADEEPLLQNNCTRLDFLLHPHGANGCLSETSQSEECSESEDDDVDGGGDDDDRFFLYIINFNFINHIFQVIIIIINCQQS